MHEIDFVKVAFPILLAIITGIATYFRSIHNIEQKFRDRFEQQTKEINDLKVELGNLKNKDELQQQILDQLKNHVLDNLPDFYEALRNKKN